MRKRTRKHRRSQTGGNREHILNIVEAYKNYRKEIGRGWEGELPFDTEDFVDWADGYLSLVADDGSSEAILLLLDHYYLIYGEGPVIKDPLSKTEFAKQYAIKVLGCGEFTIESCLRARIARDNPLISGHEAEEEAARGAAAPVSVKIVAPLISVRYGGFWEIPLNLGKMGMFGTLSTLKEYINKLPIKKPTAPWGFKINDSVLEDSYALNGLEGDSVLDIYTLVPDPAHGVSYSSPPRKDLPLSQSSSVPHTQNKGGRKPESENDDFNAPESSITIVTPRGRHIYKVGSSFSLELAKADLGIPDDQEFVLDDVSLTPIINIRFSAWAKKDITINVRPVPVGGGGGAASKPPPSSHIMAQSRVTSWCHDPSEWGCDDRAGMSDSMAATASLSNRTVSSTAFGKELLAATRAKNAPECLRLVGLRADLTVKDDNEDAALALACWSSLPDVALAIIKCPGVEIDARNRYGNTPLMYASARGLVPVVAALLSKGADINAVNKGGETALFFACSNSQSATALQLIEAGANVNPAKYKPLSRPAVNCPEMAAVKTALLARGARKEDDAAASPPPATASSSSATAASPPPATASSSSATAAPAAAAAPQTSSSSEAAAAIAATASTAKRPRPPPPADAADAVAARARAPPNSPDAATALGKKLLDAMVAKNVPECLRLVGEGADLAVKDDYGNAALLLACTHSLPEVSLAIINCPGVEIDARNNSGTTPLIRASEKGLTAVVAALLSMGADINAVDNAGNTALFFACAFSHAATALHLINADTDVNKGKDKPLRYCSDKAEMAAVKAALLARGASKEDDTPATSGGAGGKRRRRTPRRRPTSKRKTRKNTH